MNYSQTLFEIIFHIAKKHPEFSHALQSTNTAFLDLERDLGYRGTFYYSKNLKCELSRLCEKYGSDKGGIKKVGHPYPWPSHTYTDYYARLWGHCRESVKKVFECGLGTNNPNIPSSMGISGQPGASLRVWRDYFPNAQIYGADIDRDVLFTEDRIRTYYIDQLKPDVIRQYWSEVGEGNFDFMIDDGLHNFEAGSCLFSHSISKLSQTGIYVIEDVIQEDLQKYREFFRLQNYLVDYVALFRPDVTLGDNNLIVIRNAY